MNVAIEPLPKAGTQLAVVTVVAAGVAAAGLIATGLVAAVPAGVGLTFVAASDLSTQRISRRTLAIASHFVALALIVDAAVDSSWTRLPIVLVGTAAIGGLVTLIWLRDLGIAFGDVLLVSYTVVVPLFVSARTAVVVLVAALLAAGLMALARIVRHGWEPHATIALGPALLVGWLYGLVVT